MYGTLFKPDPFSERRGMNHSQLRARSGYPLCALPGKFFRIAENYFINAGKKKRVIAVCCT